MFGPTEIFPALLMAYTSPHKPRVGPGSAGTQFSVNLQASIATSRAPAIATCQGSGGGGGARTGIQFITALGRATNICDKFKLWKFWERPGTPYEISEYAFNRHLGLPETRHSIPSQKAVLISFIKKDLVFIGLRPICPSPLILPSDHNHMTWVMKRHFDIFFGWFPVKVIPSTSYDVRCVTIEACWQ